MCLTKSESLNNVQWPSHNNKISKLIQPYFYFSHSNFCCQWKKKQLILWGESFIWSFTQIRNGTVKNKKEKVNRSWTALLKNGQTIACKMEIFRFSILQSDFMKSWFSTFHPMIFQYVLLRFLIFADFLSSLNWNIKQNGITIESTVGRREIRKNVNEKTMIWFNQFWNLNILYRWLNIV
jgi:hypothetical protein